MPSLKTRMTTPLMAETAAFYRQVFDMQVAQAWDSAGDRGVILSFGPSQSEAYSEICHGGDSADFSALSLQFKVDDVSAFHDGLPEAVDYRGPTPRPWGSTYLYLRDPNGVQVIVYEERL